MRLCNSWAFVFPTQSHLAPHVKCVDVLQRCCWNIKGFPNKALCCSLHSYIITGSYATIRNLFFLFPFKTETTTWICKCLVCSHITTERGQKRNYTFFQESFCKIGVNKKKLQKINQEINSWERTEDKKINWQRFLLQSDQWDHNFL